MLAVLASEYDEGVFMIGARYVARGLRPFVDFAVHQPPLHLYLLALSAKFFGPTLFGYRMLSVLSVAVSGCLVFCLARPFTGPLPALVAQVIFLFSAPQVHSLNAVGEAPMVLFTLLGIVLLFVGTGRPSAWGSGIAFVIAALIKPTSVLVPLAAVLSLVYARAWRRLADFTLSGALASIGGLAWTFVLSDGIFTDILTFTAGRIGADRGGMWSVDTGLSDIRRILGIETRTQWTLFAMKIFYLFPVHKLPVALSVVALAGVPLWVASCRRMLRALAAFAVLWPLSCLVLDFVVLDYVSTKYFIPLLAVTAVLLAAVVRRVGRGVPRVAAVGGSVIFAATLVWGFASTLSRQVDPWYYGRVDWIAHEHPIVVSFSPLIFAATGTEPGCGLWNAPDTYGGFGQAVLGASERTRRFIVSDQRMIECLQAHPEARIMIDFWYYFFTRPGSALRDYLHGEGSGHVVFFSPQALAQWDQPRITSADVAR